MSRPQKLSAGSSDGLPRKSPLLPKEGTSNMEFHGKIKNETFKFFAHSCGKNWKAFVFLTENLNWTQMTKD